MELGDCLGIESCADLKIKVDMVGEEELDSSSSCWSRKSHRRSYSTGDIPPPITPLILRRYYTDDGRLVIRGETMKGREYFHSDRSDGRLILRLVPIRDESDDGDGEGNDDGDEDYDDDVNCEVGFESFDYTEKETDLVAAESCVAAAVSGGDDNREFTEKETNLAAAELSTGRSDTVAISGGGAGGGGGRGHLYQYCSTMMNKSPYLLGGGGIEAAALRT